MNRKVDFDAKTPAGSRSPREAVRRLELPVRRSISLHSPAGLRTRQSKLINRLRTGLSIVHLNDIVVDYNAINMDGAAKKLPIPKSGCFTHMFNPATQKIYIISTVQHRVMVLNGLQNIILQ